MCTRERDAGSIEMVKAMMMVVVGKKERKRSLGELQRKICSNDHLLSPTQDLSRI